MPLHLQDFSELHTRFQPAEFRIQWADGPWMNAQARVLRRQVFCTEQGLFGGVGGDDRDAVDSDNLSTRSLVALSCCGGATDEVLGTVRIHAAGPGLWWGSRLAVRRDWRRHAQLGTSLIQLAVSSAHALGCTEFLAHVQAQNVPLFERLNWQVLDRMDLHGKPHALMRADLAAYPPCRTPYTGLVLATGGLTQ
jgi:putative N-acetyltransferase (TIGR04045 family)